MPRTLSPEESQEIGKTYYKLKQYEKAVEAFSEGIDASAVPSVTLLDYRAAAHEKLGDYSAAVKDGRLAIRTHKQDVKGYLRTASALQKMDKHDTALGIYKYGMKNVPVQNKDFHLLQQLHNKLTRILSPPTAIDPFTILPVELVEMIMAYLPFRNMINCLRVSRGWKTYLTSRPRVWTTMDLSEAKRPVSRAFLANAVRYSRGSLHTLVVHRVPHTDILRNIATACKNLHTLSVLSSPFKIAETLIEIAKRAHNLTRLTICTEISLDTIDQILSHRPKLELLQCKNLWTSRVNWPVEGWKNGPYSRLQTLVLGSSDDPGDGVNHTFISSLIREAPELRSLTCDNLGTARDPYVHVELDQTQLTDLVIKKLRYRITIPPTLKRLVYFPRTRVNSGFSTSDSRSLTHLSLGDVTLWPSFLTEFLDVILDVDGNASPIPDGAPLQHLALHGDISINEPYDRPSVLSSTPASTLVSTYLATSPRVLTRALTSLELPGQPLTDDDIGPIVEATNLTSINISSTKVSGYGIKKLVDGAPSLRFVNADHCLNLSSRDAVEYAEARGVSVSYTMSETGKGGKARKVRYG